MKCSILKRMISFLLMISMILGIGIPALAAEEDNHPESIGLNNFFKNGYDTSLLDHSVTGHMTFVEDMRGKVVGTLAMEVLAKIYGEEPEPTEAKYMEVLINIMTTYEMENAANISQQCKMDTLKSAESYALDAVKVGTGLLFAAAKVDGATTKLMDWIEIAIGGLETVGDNTENWIEGLSDLNALLQNYAKHDAFLYQIESLATGELQSAAIKLRTSMQSAMKIKLESYSDITEANFQNYSEFFFKDVFFEALKLTEEYATDEGFRFFVDLGCNVIDIIGLYDALKLGVEIGKIVGNIAVNGEDIVNRVLEMKAVYDISIILEGWLKEVKARISTPYSDVTDNRAINYVRSGNYLISCRIRGEYCMYSLLAKDSGLYSHFGEATAKQAENVYNSLTSKLEELKEQLDGVLNVLVVNVGSEMPYEAVNTKSQWNVYGKNGKPYDNYTLRIYDKQSLINFMHTGPMDEPDPTVTEHVVDSTEPLVLTLEEGYAYTFEFVDNADAEKIKLMTVGVTDDDPLLISAVDVETEFGVGNLMQIKISSKTEDVNIITCIKTFHYGNDGNLTSIEEEEYDLNGALTAKGTLLLEMDSKGRLIKMDTAETSDIEYAYAEYRYNDKDQLISCTIADGGGSNTSYFYDAAGRLTKEEDHCDVGTIISEYTYENGKLARKVIRTQYLGAEEANPTAEEILYEVDDYGRVIKENNLTRSSITQYNYDYWPVTASTSTYESGSTSGGFQYNDSEGHFIFTDWLDDMEFFTDDEGKLNKITGLKNRVPYTYEFIYGQSEDDIAVENFPYNHEQIADMIRLYYADDYADDGRLLVIFRSESNGMSYYSLKFDPDDPDQYPEGLSMPLAELMVDMKTGELFSYYQFKTFLW